MRLACFVCFIIFAICVSGMARSGDDIPLPGGYRKVDLTDRPPGVRPGKILWGASGVTGDILQFFVIFSTKEADKSKAVRNLKVEIDGDCLTMLGVVEVPVYRNPVNPLGHDDLKRNISCFLKVVKKGKTTVKFTPIGEDGKPREPEVIEIHCFDREKEKKKTGGDKVNP